MGKVATVNLYICAVRDKSNFWQKRTQSFKWIPETFSKSHHIITDIYK